MCFLLADFFIDVALVGGALAADVFDYYLLHVLFHAAARRGAGKRLRNIQYYITAVRWQAHAAP